MVSVYSFYSDKIIGVFANAEMAQEFYEEHGYVLQFDMSDGYGFYNVLTSDGRWCDEIVFEILEINKIWNI